MADKKPNVIILMTDDMGWGDPPSYGFDRGVEMPNLDRIAAEGMRFTDWYAEASCTPGRAALQTGRLPIRSALTVALGPGSKNYLLPENRCIAEGFKAGGYNTYFSGKWHLGDVPDSYPINHGYDEMKHFLAYYAGIYAYTNAELHPAFPRDNEKFMDAYNKMVNDGEWEGKAGEEPTTVKEHVDFDDLGTIDARQTQSAIDYITEHYQDDAPFFMDINFMKFHQPNNPSAEFKGKSKQGIYYDALMEVDHYVGQIMDTIHDLGIAEDTIFLYTADNGPWVDAAPDAGYTPFRGAKGTAYEGGFRVPTFLWAPGRIEAGSVEKAMICHQDIWATLAGLAGLTPPPHGAWEDKAGNPIYFDGIDQSDYLLRKTDTAPRNHFEYVLSTSLGGLRAGPWKFHFTLDDSWLGPTLDLPYPAVYNLQMDPGEEYERFMGGSAPTTASGALQNSPGRWQGGDTAWTVALVGAILEPLNQTFRDYPNVPIVPGGSTIGADVPSFHAKQVFEGEWPGADSSHEAAKDITLDK
jgi:arylsulfatase